MKITKLIAIFCLFVPSLAFAQAPAWMPVQAYLADAEGAPLTGEHDIGLTLYDADGQALFTETQTVMLYEGLATLYLGANQTLDLALFASNPEISLGIAVDEDPEMSPRFTLGTVPFAAFAQHAASADTLGEHSADDFLLAADDADTLAGLTCAEGQVAKAGTEGWSCADDINIDTDTDTLAALICADDQVVKASAIGWICADDINTDSGGDITGVSAGSGLVGGGTSGDVTLNTASDYTFTNLDGNAYRRFRVELEGILAVGGTNRTIGLRPNGSTELYGPFVMNTIGHIPGLMFVNETSTFGVLSSVLPLCVTQADLDGHLFCTGEMNTRSGRYRMIHGRSTFATSGACGSSSCIYATQTVNDWRDSSTNITSLLMNFGGATLFNGEVTLWALK